MLSGSDKAWVGGLVSLVCTYAASRLPVLAPFITPELIAMLTGGAVYWTRNKA